MFTYTHVRMRWKRMCVSLGVPKCVCMSMCVCAVFLTNKPQEKSRLICTSLHRISINLAAIYTPGTLITLLLQNPNNSVQTSENKNKHCTQLVQEIYRNVLSESHKNSNPLISPAFQCERFPHSHCFSFPS